MQYRVVPRTVNFTCWNGWERQPYNKSFDSFHFSTPTRLPHAAGETSEMVKYFKQATISSPDIQLLVASQQDLERIQVPAKAAQAIARVGIDLTQPSPPFIFKAAKSGENFFFSRLDVTNWEASNLLSSNQVNWQHQFVTGRKGPEVYRVGANEFSTTTEEDGDDNWTALTIVEAVSVSGSRLHSCS